MNANILIIGSGGREHALAHGIAASPEVSQVFVAPGNAGTATLQKTQNVTLDGHDATLAFCHKNNIDLVVIGPEAPLIAGLSDTLRAAGFTVFGASQAAAQLEGSKSFATEFMQRHDIAIPVSHVVTDTAEANQAIMACGGAEKSVIKADGLAGGKGVFLPETQVEADEAIKNITSGAVDGDGSRFVIQQRNHGPEVSVFVLSDGENFRVIPLASQDHKRLGIGDTGPNTGGMGVYAPLPSWMLSDDQWKSITEIAKASIDGMRSEGTPYQGVLYIGIMLAEELDGAPIVIEYNARFGDPETEVIIPLLMENGVDIYAMLSAVANGGAAAVQLPEVLRGAALSVCLAAAGYPVSPVVDEVIDGLDATYDNVDVFHGGTKRDGENIVSSGGRVLFVTGLGVTLEAAAQAATSAIGASGIHFSGMQYRTDIGHRVFSRNINEVKS